MIAILTDVEARAVEPHHRSVRCRWLFGHKYPSSVWALPPCSLTAMSSTRASLFVYLLLAVQAASAISLADYEQQIQAQFEQDKYLKPRRHPYGFWDSPLSPERVSQVSDTWSAGDVGSVDHMPSRRRRIPSRMCSSTLLTAPYTGRKGDLPKVNFVLLSFVTSANLPIWQAARTYYARHLFGTTQSLTDLGMPGL